MLARTASVALIGTEGRLVDVEVDVSTGVPRFTTVGLPTKSVREAEQRVHSALLATKETWPKQRIVANLAPGELRKDGTHFDLPIALGLIAADGGLDVDRLDGLVTLGELALDGRVRPVRGVLAAAMTSRAAGRKGLICPAQNAPEAALVDGIEVVAVSSLGECLQWLRGNVKPPPVTADVPAAEQTFEDLSEVKGHSTARRAVEIAAAGGHNLLMVGPPGSGKSMLAHRLPGILPPLSMEQSLEVTRIYSVGGLLVARPSLIRTRPFRSPHHHVSLAGLIGGGSGLAGPGEVSFAHHGVLFLDELPLYRREALESLRAPLEDKVVHIARSGGAISFPCSFCLVAAMNPCPCGYLGDGSRACRCTAAELQRYRSRISGPLLDRFDIKVDMQRLDRHQLMSPAPSESSDAVRARVELARTVQSARNGWRGQTNASVAKGRLDETVVLAGGARELLARAVDELSLSGRGVNRVLRVARTIADLSASTSIAEEHIGEALTLRMFDGRPDVAT
jgi:magnesium chelatase family protein